MARLVLHCEVKSDQAATITHSAVPHMSVIGGSSGGSWFGKFWRKKAW
jgi:hypothetical protein